MKLFFDCDLGMGFGWLTGGCGGLTYSVPTGRRVDPHVRLGEFGDLMGPEDSDRGALDLHPPVDASQTGS